MTHIRNMPRVLVYLLLALLALPMARAGEYGAALEPLLAGEFALQNGDGKAAAVAYARAARSSTDPVVAMRAVQVALAARDLARARSGLARWQTLEPDSPALAAGYLRLALLEGRRQRAQKQFVALIEREDGWRLAVAALAHAPDAVLAGAIIEEARVKGQLPERIDTWLALGGLALRLEARDLYLRLSESAVKRFPQAAQAWIWRADAAWEAGDKDGMRAALAAAQALPGLDTGARLAIAAQLARSGDAAAAARVLAEAGDEDVILGPRVAYLTQAGDESGLAALYRQIKAGTKADEASPERLLLLAHLAESIQDDAAALAWYRRIRGGIQRDQAQLRIAVLLDRDGQAEAALAVLHALQNDATEWGDVVRDAYLLEAELLRGRGAHERELDALERGLAVFENDPVLRYMRALSHERGDRVSAALVDLRALVVEQPDNADFLNALGYTLVDRTGALQEGLGLIEKALALKPDSPSILDSMGWALHRLGRSDEALDYLRRAFAQQRDAEVAAHLAAVLYALGQRQEAESMLRLAREIDPGHRALRHLPQESGR